MGVFDFTFYQSQKTEYLVGHNGLKLEFEGDSSDIRPFSREMRPLQAIIDKVLTILDPHPVLNNRGWIRTIHDITKGYKIYDPMVWRQLTGHLFREDKTLPGLKFFYSYFNYCEETHPSKHRSGLLFDVINGLMALWGTIEESKIKELWKLFQNENGSCFDSLPPEHSLLLSLFCREEIPTQFPKRLLEILVFINGFFVHTENSPFSTATPLFLDNQEQIAIQLKFGSELYSHLFLKFFLKDCYLDLVSYCSHPEFEQLISQFLKQFLLSFPLKIDQNTILREFLSSTLKKTNFQKTVLDNRAHESPSVQLLNFYLLLAIYQVDPRVGVEIALLEAFPKVYDLQKSSGSQLQELMQLTFKGQYSKVITRFIENKKSDSPHESQKLWIAALLERNHIDTIRKLIRLLPFIKKQLKEGNFSAFLKL